MKGGLTSNRKGLAGGGDSLVKKKDSGDSPPWDAVRSPHPVPAPDAFFTSEVEATEARDEQL